MVLVGAASKGIIQRGFQHNATVYKTPYAKNPFDAVTDQELDQYKKEVERKHKGDPCKYFTFEVVLGSLEEKVRDVGKIKAGNSK